MKVKKIPSMHAECSNPAAAFLTCVCINNEAQKPQLLMEN